MENKGKDNKDKGNKIRARSVINVINMDKISQRFYSFDMENITLLL